MSPADKLLWLGVAFVAMLIVWRLLWAFIVRASAEHVDLRYSWKIGSRKEHGQNFWRRFERGRQ